MFFRVSVDSLNTYDIERFTKQPKHTSLSLYLCLFIHMYEFIYTHFDFSVQMYGLAVVSVWQLRLSHLDKHERHLLQFASQYTNTASKLAGENVN